MGYLGGLGKFRRGQGIVSLQYAYDTLIFIQADHKKILYLKWLLYGF